MSSKRLISFLVFLISPFLVVLGSDFDASCSISGNNVTGCSPGRFWLEVSISGSDTGIIEWYDDNNNLVHTGFHDVVIGENTYQTPVLGYGTHLYRVEYSGFGGCTSTRNISVTINSSNVNGGAIDDIGSQCYGTYLYVGSISPADNVVDYEWQVYDNSQGYFRPIVEVFPADVFSAAEADLVTTISIVENLFIRRKANVRNSCGELRSAYSNSININLLDQTTAGQIRSNQYLCPGESPGPILTVSPGSGVSPFSYQWQQSVDGSNWTDIPDETGESYLTPPAVSRYYRRLAMGTCGSVGTPASRVIVQTYNNNLSFSGTTTCSPGAVTVEASFDQLTTGLLQWYDSQNELLQEDFVDVIISGYSYTTISLGYGLHAYTAVFLGDNGCSHSYFFSINVLETTTDAGQIEAVGSICFNTNLSIQSVSEASNLVTYEWQIANNLSGEFLPMTEVFPGDVFVGSEGDLFTTVYLEEDSYFRRKATVRNACNQNIDVYSNTIHVIVDRLVNGGQVQSATQYICDFEASTPSIENVSVASATGTSNYQWQTSINGLDNWYDIPGEINLNLNLPFTTAYYRRRVSNACGEMITSPVYIRHCNEPTNWIQTDLYGEDNEIIGASISYFDDAGKVLQTQTRQISTTSIMVSQTVDDLYDRPVLTGLSAPVDQSAFSYMPNFIENSEGLPYGADDIGEPVNQANPNTLGWYYSVNNTLEDNVPITDYPYSQIEYYDDGTGDIKRSAGVGEELRIGSGHEVYTRTFGVTTELDDYVGIRNQLLGQSGPITLGGEVVQTFTIDQNGNKSVSFSDRSENVLLTARAISAATDLAMKPAYTMEDKSYNFYDDAGRLKVSIAPNGVLAIETAGGISTFTDLENLPFTTYYTYNHQGWLLSTQETDAGTTNYIYRKDGSIRYSQNAQQKVEFDFSYTDYDALGRPVESGEINLEPLSPSSTFEFTYLDPNGIDNVNDLLAVFDNPALGFSASKQDWIQTHYDLSDPDFATETGLSLTQEFVMGAISYTENEHIKTWYSYDEQGRVTWMVQKPVLLNRTFLIGYNYDFLGNVLSVGFKSYSGATPLDQFYHYYTYDADKRLSSVYTSLNEGLDLATIESNPEAELQAHYEYYLHGPLKRIELGGNLQGIDFVYNIQGWLKSINDPDDPTDEAGFSEDAFGMILNYFENNMSNLFGISQNDLKPKPFQFHGLEEEDRQASLVALYDLFSPSQAISAFSASNPIYTETLKSLQKNRTAEMKGGAQ
ncbi:MAG: hypothetical protein AAGF85_11515 [Bacteroidota bacterium]